MGAALITLGLLGACSTETLTPVPTPTTHSSSANRSSATAAINAVSTAETPFAHAGALDLGIEARRAKPLVYVANQQAGTVQVIDPSTYRVVATYPVGRSPEQVVPSPDLRTLWVTSDAGNSMTPIDPRTGEPGKAIVVSDPGNLYFTPDGRYALVMAAGLRRIDIRDAHTMKLVRSLPIPCAGINHADYTADLSTLVVSCELSGKLVVVDSDAARVVKMIGLDRLHTPGTTVGKKARPVGGPTSTPTQAATARPQDVQLSPDGRWLLVADGLRNGVWVIDAHTLKYSRFVPTGKGADGICLSRDTHRIYVSNRDAGTITVLDADTLAPVATWTVPGGGSPDLGGVTADGKQLWLSGRNSSVVYVIDTSSGRVTHLIPVLAGPHGLLVWPQPGRSSLGNTGTLR
ncbi:hypothetical protein BA895_11470 [Humibacillus sp. DSM 29435]|uniref:YVTN family beta-propeller repeat protein n=1 Tax=Humibacillus sp. DSM 29435 TaxID=1869167 RepID=UPI00087312C5|nr:beta-propeller fold lactonase family protein [Humibacillus sp. DSM 29435]OFE14227.1 hypothetical protein BA895_11470 [Humibacillus sp. DSM 29435]